MAEEEGPNSFFRSFAGAMLERSLPAIREWLRSRLGPSATIGAVTLDDGRVVVTDSHIPIGARLVLDVDEAILDARPEDLMAGLPPARLRSLRGALRAVSGGKTTFLAPVEVAGKGSESQAWVDGEVRIGGATWELATGVGDALPMYGTGQLRITSDGWNVTDANLTSGASQTKLDARGSLGEGGAGIVEAVLGTRFARLGHLLDVLAAFRGQELRVPFGLPLDAIVDGTLSLDPEGTLEVDATGRTDRTDLALKLASKGRVIERAELTGTVAPDEMLPEWLDRLLDRTQSEPFTLTANGRGALDALDGTVELDLPALASPWLRAPRPAGAKIALRGGRRWTVDVAIDGGGTGQLQLGVAPYGSIDGAAMFDLEPGVWVVGPYTAEGEPVRIEAQIGGTRSEPEVKLDLAGTVLAVSAADRALSTKRPRAKALVQGTKTGLQLTNAWGQARVGPGSAELDRRGSTTRVQLARVDASDALAGLALVAQQDWIGETDEARFRVPEGAQLWADVTIEGGRVSGQGHVETKRSRLSMAPLCFEQGSFEGSEAMATLDFDDAIALGLFRGSPALPAGPGVADLHATLTGRGPDARLATTVTARRVGWRFVGGEPLLSLDHARVELELTRDGLELRGLTARLFGGRLEARGGLRRDGDRLAPRLDALSLRGAHDGLRERLLGDDAGDAWAGLSLDAELAGDLEALTGHATVTSDRSRLEATIETQGRAFAAGSAIRGTVNPGDVGPWIAPVAIEGEAMKLSARLEGDWARPSVELEIEGGEQHLVVGPARASMKNLRVRATLGEDGLEVPEASAWIAGGRVEGRGVVSRAFGGSIARLTVEGVRLEDIDRVSDELGGGLHLDAAVWKRGARPAGARLAARVERPVYVLLSRFAALFSRYGLRQPERSSVRSLTARLRLVDGRLEVADVEAGTRSFGVSGHATRSPLGVWHGDAAVVVKQVWLGTSHLFARPSRWVGDVRVPIRMDGPDGDVRIRADVLATLDALLAKTALGRGLQVAIEALMRTLRFEAPAPLDPPARHHSVSSLTTSDALIDRIAADATESDAAIDALLERGFEPKEIVTRVTRRR